MLEINEDIPFLWRLSSENEQGFSLVSMVIPISGSQNLEHTIQTDIVSFNGEQDVEAEETLEWNEEDLSLFLKLLNAKGSGAHGSESIRTYKVDLSDPDTIEIVHIVAAAGFGMALTVDDLLVNDPGDSLKVAAEPDIGAQVTLHTVDGYKRGVVVGNEEEDDSVVCVMLDGIRQPADHQSQLSDIHPHDLVVVKPHNLLSPLYSSREPQPHDVLH
ncbi:MAG TPA: hypothetical protein VNR18_11815 [Hyphomicrobiales bacterium]|nr:hypothetical protein [Hyphomicrobiales bacterium]